MTTKLPIQTFISLQIGSRTFRVRKALLMNKMKYFETMFTTDMKEKTQTTIVLSPEIVQPEVFDRILDYIYIDTLDLAKDIRALYRAADYLHFEELSRRIELYMTTDMTIENVILYKAIAIEFSVEELNRICNQFIINNSNIDRAKLIPLLSFDELIGILDKLSDLSRDMFYYAIDWVSDMKNERERELAGLMKSIPLEALSRTFLNEVISKYELILIRSDCYGMFLQAILNKPRYDILYVIGGFNETALPSVSEYNSTTRKWTATTPMPRPKSALFGIAVLNHKIYLCGGRNDKGIMNELKVFDTHSRTWTQLTPMKYARGICSAAVLNRQIYVAGGRNEIHRFARVERYNPKNDQWSEVAPMTTVRSRLELIALNGFLYAIGGDHGSGKLNSVERYNPQTDHWSAMNNTNNKYAGFGSAVLNGNIYIAKGEKCEVYDPTDDKWTKMPAPSGSGSGRLLAAYDGELYAIGGVAGEVKDFKGSKIVQVYDFEARVWRSEPDMDVARCYHGVAVVKN